MNPNADSNWRATASVETLQLRAKLLRRTRSFFDDRGFFEVQTPLLSADTVVDRHLDPVPVRLPSNPYDLSSGRPMWLQTSPEFAMKRLVASGADAIYQITPAFRIGETGKQHNPEFTMLEWYREGDDLSAGMNLLADFVAELLNCETAEIKTIRRVCEEYVGADLLSLSADELAALAKNKRISIPSSVDPGDWDTWFDLLFSELVQPRLGQQLPVIVHDYPASQAALAKVRRFENEPPVAERFELFYHGVELANGYNELLDADELTRRNQKVNQQRQADGKPILPESSQLLEAMHVDSSQSGLPPCAGVALGFDRLVMLASGATDIREVIAFPTDRA